MTEWYFRNGEEPDQGPVTSKQLLDLIHAGTVVEQTWIRKDDSQWVPAVQVNGLWQAAQRPTIEYLCPMCRRPVEPPPTRCKRCEIPVTKPLERLVQHDLGPKEKKGLLSNLIPLKKPAPEPIQPAPTPNHLDDTNQHENWASWVGDMLNRKNRKP